MSAITPSANHPLGTHVVSYGSYHDKRGFTRFFSSITRTLRMNSLSRAHRVMGNACGIVGTNSSDVFFASAGSCRDCCSAIASKAGPNASPIRVATPPSGISSLWRV